MAKRRSLETGLEPDAAVSAKITPETLARDARNHQLDVYGILHEGSESIILLGPYEPGFWQRFTESDPYNDGLPDPLDRWSKVVIGDLATRWQGQAMFPSDGPPYHPFISWALRSGRCWQSPVGLLVHDTAGLWVSFRGAVRLPLHVELHQPDCAPCETCEAPCRSACPVDALANDGYDVGTCIAHLNRPDSANCMSQGCAARRTCPVSQTYGRLANQSAFHMKAFNPS